MIKFFFPVLFLTQLLFTSFPVNAQLRLNSFTYDERVFSQERKSELGDQTRLQLGARYHFSEETFAGFRFQSLPSFNLDAFEADRFEFTFGHKYQNLDLLLDLDLMTDAGPNGGAMTVAIDQDSDGTLIRWRASKFFNLSFYPFNFNGRVGHYYRTWDVTRIYIIEGSPTIVSQTANTSANERIIEKTLPGIVMDLNISDSTNAYLGVGMSTFLYPTNADFDITDNPSATSWERVVDYGVKLGFNHHSKKSKIEAKYVTHSNAKQTGSLLETGASIYTLTRIGNKFLIDLELTYTKAGEAPYRLNRTRDWFVDEAPFRPVFSDFFGNEKQDWVGAEGHGVSMRFGIEQDNFTPYLLARWQSEHLLFNKLESAHLLRTKDLTHSHGGLTRFGLGAYFYHGNFSFNPEIEYRKAQNSVFSNATDVPADRILGSFRKDDVLVSFFINYSYGKFTEFKL